VNLCIEWLRHGTVAEEQSQALRYALNRFTSRSLATDKGWVEWYEKGGLEEYPEPDFERWHADLKRHVVIPCPAFQRPFLLDPAPPAWTSLRGGLAGD
jgi:hypothetical protein